MNTLNDRLDDPGWVEELKKKDPLAFKANSYLIAGKSLRDEVFCSLETHCKYGAELGKGEECLRYDAAGNTVKSPSSFNWVFCYCCNRITHLGCFGFGFRDFVKSELKFPWNCPECVNEPDNSRASMFFSMKSVICLSVTARKEAFVKPFSAIDLNDADAEEMSYQDKFEKQRCEFEDLSVRFVDLANSKRESDKQAAEMQQKLTEFDAMKQQMEMMQSQIAGMSRRDNSVVIDKGKGPKRVSFMSSTMAFAPVLTVKDLLSQTYLSNDSSAGNSTRFNFNVERTAPLTEQHRSFIDDIDLNNLTRTERLTLEQTQAQLATSEAQREIAHTMNLERVRKALPKITPFDGDPRKWIQFMRDVKRYKDVGKYDEDLMRLNILQALKGKAYDRVCDIIDTAPLDLTWQILEDEYGDPERIIDKCSSDVLAIKLGKDYLREEVSNVTTKIQSFFSACKYANIGYINSNHLAQHIFAQLGASHKEKYRQQMRANNAGTLCNLVELESLYEFLIELCKDLERKKAEEKSASTKPVKTAQVNVAAVNAVPVQAVARREGAFYEMKDKNSCVSGYDIRAVSMLNKVCDCCGRNGHFLLQCNMFKGLSESDKLKMANEKSYCRNCLLTSAHRAAECNLKGCCGLSTNNGNCGRKHHEVLHRVGFNSSRNFSRGNRNSPNSGSNGNNRQFRRSNTNANQNRAANILNSSENSNSVQTAGQPAQQVNTVNSVIQQAPNLSQVSNLNASSNVQRSQPQSRQAAVTYTALSGNSNVNKSDIEVKSYSSARQLMTVQGVDIQRTVKVFKNKFLGREGFAEGYSIGDSAAEVTLLTDDLREKLGIEGENCVLKLQWTDGSLKTLSAKKVDIEIQGVHDKASIIMLRNCYAIKDLLLPSRSLDVDMLKNKFPYLSKVDFESYSDVSPWMLIGSPHASVIESNNRLYEGGEGKPVGLKSKLGWSIYGGCPDEMNELTFSVESIVANDVVVPRREKISNEDLFDLYSYFCSIESLGITVKVCHNTDLEQKAIEIVKEEMRTLQDGSIELPLVWNRENNLIIPRIPNNLRMVYKRQLSHDSKLSKKPAHLQAYIDKFREMIQEGYVRALNSDDIDGNWGNVNYIPMSLVANENKIPPKFRIVFDASARYGDTSLNENLLKGPDLLVNIIKPLLSMRANKVAFTADIKSMFMRMKICLRDQQCQRVLYRESFEEEFKVFVVTSMLFGPAPSPFCSQFVKNFVADKWKEIYPKAADVIEKEMYMDDILTSVESVKEAVDVAKQCIEIFNSVNWELVSFQSNSLELLKSLPQANVKQEAIPLLENEGDSCVTKVLGCVWDTKQDCYIFKFDRNLFVRIVKECQHRPTKRDQCSTVARIFDVLGLISHFVVRGKILLQRSWLENIGWDEQITEAMFNDWMKWINDLESIAEVKIPRQFCKVANLANCDKVELHTFSDAGCEAFGSICYIVTTVGNERYSNIVMAKAKVTPIRHKSRTKISEMPRLELCANLIGLRLADLICRHYSSIKMKRYFWCDNQAVLYWILNPNHRLIKYAIAPIEEILDKSDRSEWRYVPTKLNTADYLTKFCKIDLSDSNSNWFKGPVFLRLNEEHWPPIPEQFALPKDEEESESGTVRNVNISNVFCISKHKLPGMDCPIMGDYCLNKFSSSIKSSWPKLVRATARGLKLWLDGFIPLVKSKRFKDLEVRNKIKTYNNGFKNLTPSDLERAELFLIRIAQKEAYKEEYEALRENREVNNVDFKQLNVFIDSEGLLRINSRVSLPEEFYPQRYALLLPRKNAIIRMYLFYVHQQYQHICIESQIAEIRSRFWIPQLRAALKSIQYNCNLCSLKRAKPYIPSMAPLPDCRTNPSLKPFETTGLDCLGPIMTLNYTKTKKVWVLIFACALTRFISLHILDSLESVKVLEAIVTFWASHGPVRTFISDRGTNFVGAANVLEEDRKNTIKFLSEQNLLLSQQLAEKYRVEWKLLPAHSPWMGGFYERLIKEVKRAIAHALDNRKLTKVALNIALNDAAHRINNRPLTHNSVSSEDEPILTPHLLAKGKSGWPYLPGLPSTNSADINLDRSVYRKGRALADEIMRRFHRNYLPILTKRTKWFRDEKALNVGDLVLLIEPNETRAEWRRARVIKLHKGRDTKHRVADVELPDKSIKKSRSVQRLAKIEIKQVEDAQ